MPAPSPITTAQNDDALVFESFQTKLETYNDLEEVYFGLAGQVGPGGRVPPAIIAVVNLGDRIQSNVRTMVMPLRTPAKMGDNHVAEDFGESLNMKALRTYVNSWDKVANRQDYVTTLQGHASGKAFFMAAADALRTFTPIQRGDYIRHAAIESYSQNLTTQADGGPNLTARYCMNWHIANTPRPYANPTYSSNAATFLTNLLAGFANAGNSDNDYATIEAIHRLNFVATQIWKVRGLNGTNHGGRKVIMMGPRSVSWLMSLSSAGSAAFLKKSTYADKIATQAWQDPIGELPGGIVVVKDERAPIAVYTISTNSLQIVYKGVDPEVDPREAFVSGPDTKVFELNVVAGQNYFTNTVATAPMYRDQEKDFARMQQVAVLAVEGFTITEFDSSLASNQTDLTRVGQGGGIFATYIPPAY